MVENFQWLNPTLSANQGYFLSDKLTIFLSPWPQDFDVKCHFAKSRVSIPAATHFGVLPVRNFSNRLIEWSELDPMLLKVIFQPIKIMITCKNWMPPWCTKIAITC